MNLDNLNEMQQKAVTCTEGPLLVLAGAGSGKTRVLTSRVAYLIKEKHIDPAHILAITFTNKAAKEMKSRIFGMLGGIAYQIQISTFHSFGLLILKENFDKLGYEKHFTIIDSDDSLTIIKKILKEQNLDSKDYNPKAIRSRISGAKNNLLSPSEYEKYVNTDFETVVTMIYQKYQKKLEVSNSVDFDDLLMLPIKIFRMYPEVLKYYQEKYQYILIDEYQDTNEAQYILTKMISAKYKNICVVGDNDQAIYSFRGSNYQNILNFEKDYDHPKVILLEENYRSTGTILKAANEIIKHNKQRKDKNLWTNNDEGDKITYHRCFDEKEEAAYVVEEIDKLIKKNVPEREIAVLYRTNAQSRVLEEEMLKFNIPYKIVGSFYFYNRREIKDLISYLKLLYNPYDDLSLLRIINVPKRGIGLKTISNLTEKAALEGKSLYETIDSGKELTFKKIIEDIKSKIDELSLTELIEYILDKSGIRDELKSEKTIESEVRLENLEEFKSITRNFEYQQGIVSLEEFLEQISLVSDVEEHRDKTDVVTLMTIHSAKGLEFDYVFLPGVEEGIFPHNNSMFDALDLEEERRLCYVAITRARRKVWISNARRRMLFGNDSVNPPSRFIDEIPSSYLDSDVRDEKITVPTSMNKMINEKEEYTIGQKIEFDLYGIGMIVGIDDRILTVAFPYPVGIKKLMKGHKKIRKV